MNLKSRIRRLEDATAKSETPAWDLTLLTDAEVRGLALWQRKAQATGDHVPLTPELRAALERVKR